MSPQECAAVIIQKHSLQKCGTVNGLTFRHRASCILGQAFHCSPENAFYIFNQQMFHYLIFA